VIALLSDAKRTLGPEAKVKVAGGALIVSESLETLFGSDTGSKVKPEAEPWINGVIGLLKAHPEMQISIEGLTMIGDLSIAAIQATAVMNALRKDEALKNRSLWASGRDGNFSEGIDIVIQPDYRKFYYSVKSEVQR
jgi:hypothetical protein